MRTLLVILFMAAVPASAESRLTPYVFHGALQTGDILSTRQAIGRGAREGNPVALEPIKVLAGVVLAEGDRYLDRRGKTKAKWTSRVVLGLAYGLVIRHNHRTMR